MRPTWPYPEAAKFGPERARALPLGMLRCLDAAPAERPRGIDRAGIALLAKARSAVQETFAAEYAASLAAADAAIRSGSVETFFLNLKGDAKGILIAFDLFTQATR